MKEETQFPDYVLKMVDELKKKHNLNEVNVIRAGDKFCYLKTPDRQIYKMAVSVGETRIDEAEIILENCWLAGDTEFKTDDSLFISCIPQFLSLLEIKEVELKKL